MGHPLGRGTNSSNSENQYEHHFLWYITARVRSTREGNVLTRVCPGQISLSTGGGGQVQPMGGGVRSSWQEGGQVQPAWGRGQVQPIGGSGPAVGGSVPAGRGVSGPAGNGGSGPARGGGLAKILDNRMSDSLTFKAVCLLRSRRITFLKIVFYSVWSERSVRFAYHEKPKYLNHWMWSSVDYKWLDILSKEDLMGKGIKIMYPFAWPLNLNRDWQFSLILPD